MRKFRALSLQKLVYRWNKNKKIIRNNTTLFRNDYNNKKKIKLFSLLDINDKITNSKGTSIPAQYQRYIDSEIHNRFGFTNKINQNIEPYINNKKFIRCKSDIGDRLKLKKKFKINKSVKNDENRNSMKGLIISKKERLTRNHDEITKDNIIIRKDSQLPKGYDSYELLVKHPKLYRTKIKFGNSLDKMISPNEMKQIELKSDIFFEKPPSEKESIPKFIKRKIEYRLSDIFNIKNDSKNLSKSGEIYLLKNPKRIRYNISCESNSKWKMHDNKIPALTNYSSKEYNILNPRNKGISFTRENLMIECENKKDKDSKIINNIKYMNPTHKRKGLTEFFDITRNGATNSQKNYINAYNNNPKCFYKNNDLCTSFCDIHFQYNNICQKPFYKNLF